MARGTGENGEKVQGIRSINVRYKNRQGEVKNRIGNGEAKELICMTHGHELTGGGIFYFIFFLIFIVFFPLPFSPFIPPSTLLFFFILLLTYFTSLFSLHPISYFCCLNEVPL